MYKVNKNVWIIKKHIPLPPLLSTNLPDSISEKHKLSCENTAGLPSSDSIIRPYPRPSQRAPQRSLPAHAAIVRTMNVYAMPDCPFGVAAAHAPLSFVSIPYYIFQIDLKKWRYILIFSSLFEKNNELSMHTTLFHHIIFWPSHTLLLILLSIFVIG